jgi:hypothetical protein
MRNSIYEIEKENYSRHPKPIDFDTLYDLFKKGRPLKDIGKQSGLSRERVRQIYNSYFKRVFKNKTHSEVRNKIKVRKKIALFLAQNPILDAINNRCIANNLKFELEPTISGYKKTRIKINGCRCAVTRTYESTKFAKGKAPRYSRVNIPLTSMNSVDFVIIYQVAKLRFFVEPSSELVKYLSKGDLVQAYMPLVESMNHRRPAKVNHFDYIENWNILK